MVPPKGRPGACESATQSSIQFGCAPPLGIRGYHLNGGHEMISSKFQPCWGQVFQTAVAGVYSQKFVGAGGNWLVGKGERVGELTYAVQLEA